jgi:hypothetical protein
VGRVLSWPFRVTGITDVIGIEDHLQRQDKVVNDLKNAAYGGNKTGRALGDGAEIVAGTCYFGAGGLSAASSVGLTELGTVPLSQVPRQAVIEYWTWGLGGAASGAGGGNRPPVPITQPGVPPFNPALPRPLGPPPANWIPWYPGQLPGVGSGPYPLPGTN